MRTPALAVLPLLRPLRSLATLVAPALLLALPAFAQPVAWDMVDSTSSNLTSFTDDPAIPFTSPADGFQKYRRGVSPTIPFAVLDDTTTFSSDALGIVDSSNSHEFFGAADTVNSDTSSPVTATWVFDISAASNSLVFSIDVGAMGDFESSDTFVWRASIDGAPAQLLLENGVDETSSLDYTLESGKVVTLDDPLTLQGAVLSNQFQTFSAPIVGTGSALSVTLTIETNGNGEAMAFQNLVISESAPELEITEIMYNPSSSEDDWEWVEITNTGLIEIDLTGWVIDDINGTSHPSANIASAVVAPGATAVLYNADDLSAADFLAAWGDDVPLVAVTRWSAMALNNGGDTVGLWQSFAAYSGDHTTHMNAFRSVAFDDSGSWPSDDNSASIFLTDLASDPADGANWARSTNGGATTNFPGYQSMALSGNSGNDVGSPGPGDFGPPVVTDLEIFEIQGDGESSLFEGQTVRTADNVVTALGLDGFFIQTPTSRTDGLVDTSDGLFVFTGGAPTVAIGDQVDVEGQVAEFFGFTELTGVSITVDSVGHPLPPAVIFDQAVPSADPASPSCLIEFECYEGMRISMPVAVVGGSNQAFNPDPFAEVFVAAGPARAFRETGIEFPGLPGLPVWDGNPEVFELDPDRLGLANQVIPAGSVIAASGVLGFEFGGYELWPTELEIVVEAPLPRPVRAATDDELTVGTFNLFRLFDDVDDPGTQDDGQVPSSADYAIRRGKQARYILEVLGAPAILAVQEVESRSVLDTLASDIAALDPGVVYSALLIEGNDVGGIDVGFLVRQDVAVDAVTQLAAGEILSFDGSLLHDRPPLLLDARYVGDGHDFPVSVIAVHNRSLSGIDGSNGERVRQKRLEQAQSIAAIVQDLQTADPRVHLVITGDFNAFEFTDGYVDVVGQIAGTLNPSDNLVSGPDLVDPDLVIETADDTFVPASERYSFAFRGNAQALDHALTSSALSPLVTGFEFGRGNADAAVNYVLEPGTARRSSDHDGGVLYLLMDGDLDGVVDNQDACLDTVFPESVPTERLGTNRYALVDDDRIFDTRPPKGNGAGGTFTLDDTAGCSCEQIIDELGLSNGHRKFGCSRGVMQNWISSVSP